jgi:hypothetical protein
MTPTLEQGINRGNDLLVSVFKVVLAIGRLYPDEKPRGGVSLSFIGGIDAALVTSIIIISFVGIISRLRGKETR